MNKTLMIRSVVVSLGGFDGAIISGVAQEIKNIWNLCDLIHGMAIAIAFYGTTPVDPGLDHGIGRPGIRWEDYTNGPPQNYARKAVRFEKRLELCLEGHRFFDLLGWR